MPDHSPPSSLLTAAGRRDAKASGRPAWRQVLLPGLMTALMLPVLLGLGTWQMHRRAWKAGLLADIARAEAAGPAPLVGSPAQPAPFVKLSASGAFRPGTALYGVDARLVRGVQTLGADLIAVLDRPGERPLLVDLGWVPTERPPPPLPPGVVQAVGYARLPDRAGWIGVSADPAARRFFTLDPARIGAELGAPDVLPFTLVVLGDPGADPSAPVPADSLPQPPDNHLVYALTWYGFALTLVIVFSVWTRKALRA